MLDALVGPGAGPATRESFRKKLRNNELEDKEIEIAVQDTGSFPTIDLISQASSEHSICFAVRERDAQKAADVIQEEFKSDFENDNLNKIQIEEDLIRCF